MTAWSERERRKEGLLINASKGGESDRAEILWSFFLLSVLRGDCHTDGTRGAARSDLRIGWSIRMLSRRSTWIFADALCPNLDSISGIRHATLPL